MDILEPKTRSKGQSTYNLLSQTSSEVKTSDLVIKLLVWQTLIRLYEIPYGVSMYHLYRIFLI